MDETDKKVDEKEGDDILKRMLKTPPEPKTKGDDRSRRPESHEKPNDSRNTE